MELLSEETIILLYEILILQQETLLEIATSILQGIAISTRLEILLETITQMLCLQEATIRM